MSSQASPQTPAGLFPRGFDRETDSRWPLRRVDTLVELKYGKSLVEAKRSPGDIPVYGTNGRCGWHNEGLSEGPGVILGRKGMGHLGVEWSEGDYWVIDTAYSVDPIEGGLDLKWFYYLIYYIGLDHLKEGTSNPSLQRETFGAQLVPYPPAAEQCRIAHILGTLDDKIELNRRMNRTLEAIARGIFKSWFIDFDPVIDNAILHDKPIPKEFAERAAIRRRILARQDGNEGVASHRDLLPDSFQDSPLGRIPRGWEVGELNGLLELSRVSIKPQEQPQELFDHYSFPACDAGSPARELGESIRSSKYVVPPAAVLISKLNPHIPRVWFPNVVEERRSICSTEFLVCTPRAGISREYLYSLLSSSAFLNGFAQMVTGTTGSHQRVRPTAFTAMHAVKPSLELLAAFTHAVKPLFARFAVTTDESRNLAGARDALLPRLLSGELRASRERQESG